MFSSRIPREMVANELTQLLAQKLATSQTIIDLTQSNPTTIGLDYPQVAILAALSQPPALIYQPHAKGLVTARQAIVDYYQTRNVIVDIEHILLTASTSEAYTLLFKLLMEPGESVLVPVPSYPLFEHLAQVECIRPLPYPIHFDTQWHFDFAALEAACQPHTRAIIIVHPNNPTGSYLKKFELARLIDFCQRHQLALISDEVFYDYAHEIDPQRAASMATVDEILTITMNGLSKAVGLPQMKLGWMVVNGPRTILSEALERLEFITDLFLSVGSPIQHALPAILSLAADIQGQIAQRVAQNRQWLATYLNDSLCRLLPAEGGWYAVLQIPRIIPEEQLVMQLLEQDNILVHPGYFFDFPAEGWLVVTLLTPYAEFCAGIIRLRHRIEVVTNHI